MNTAVRTILLGILTAALLVPAIQAQQVTEVSVPRLIVSLQPAQGVVPLERSSEPPIFFENENPRPRVGDVPSTAIYAFEISAFDPKGFLASAHGFVRPGQKKEIRGGTASVHVRGIVRMTALGVANYEAELWMDGKPVASTGAMLNFNPEPLSARPR